MVLGFIIWNIVGLLVGFLVGKIFNRQGTDARHDLVAGAGGAALGGLLFCRFSAAGYDVFDRWSLVAATVGAAVMLLLWHRMRHRRNGI